MIILILANIVVLSLCAWGWDDKEWWHDFVRIVLWLLAICNAIALCLVTGFVTVHIS